MADIKSLQTLVSELQLFLRSLNRMMDVSTNSLIYDMVIRPYATGGKLIMDEVNVVKNLHILSALSGTDLDNEGTNYGLERSTGVAAAVTLTFYANSLPGGDVTIPSGQQASTNATPFASAVTFSVDSTTVFASADMASYYSHDRGRYEFPVSATCDSVGTDGNISALYANSIVGGAPAGVSGVTNLTAAVGGEGLESDDDFRERIRLAKIGRGLNMANGLRGYLLGLGFQDALAIRCEDEDSERATGVDAFVVDYSSESYTETFTYYAAQTRYYFMMRPVLEVTAVVDNGGTPIAVYSPAIDTSSPLRRSVYAMDYIDMTGCGLGDGDTFTVTYNYCSAIYQGQQTILLPANRILTADVLLKRAFPLSLYFTATLTLKANADGPSTRTKVRNALAQYMNENYRLGDPVQASDFVIVMQEGYGDYPVDSVDAVYLDTTTMYCEDEFGTTYTPTNDIITLTDTQHAVYGAATII